MEKIKHFLSSQKGKNILTVLILILVGLGSFSLGRMSKGSYEAKLSPQYSSEMAQKAVSEVNSANTGQTSQKGVSGVSASSGASVPAGKNFFASSRGTKYYPVGCPAGQNLKPDNRVYFTTGEEAQKAGYTLSSSC